MGAGRRASGGWGGRGDLAAVREGQIWPQCAKGSLPGWRNRRDDLPFSPATDTTAVQKLVLCSDARTRRAGQAAGPCRSAGSGTARGCEDYSTTRPLPRGHLIVREVLARQCCTWSRGGSGCEEWGGAERGGAGRGGQGGAGRGGAGQGTTSVSQRRASCAPSCARRVQEAWPGRSHVDCRKSKWTQLTTFRSRLRSCRPVRQCAPSQWRPVAASILDAGATLREGGIHVTSRKVSK